MNDDNDVAEPDFAGDTGREYLTEDASDLLGPRVPATVPDFADSQGEWLPFVEIARSAWGD